MSSRTPSDPRRFTEPDRLPGATAFATDRDCSGSLAVVRLIKSQRPLLNELRRRTHVDRNWGRRRERGTWALAYCAFTVSGHVDIQPWLDSTTDELRRACEFPAGKPPYKRVWRRFRELEDHSDAFLGGTATLVQRGRAHDKRVGAHVTIDGTEDEPTPRWCTTAPEASARANRSSTRAAAAGPAAADGRSASRPTSPARSVSS